MMTDRTPDATPKSGAAMDRRIAATSHAKWRRRGIMAFCVLLLMVLAFWFLPSRGSSDVAASDIEIGTVAHQPFADYVPIRATVAPAVTTLVSAVTGGRVERLLVQDGTAVSADQPLLTLANPELRLEVLSREAEIAGRLGDVSGQDLSLERNRLDRASQTAQANYDLIKAKRDLAIRQQLHDQGFVSDEGVKSFAEEVAYQQNRLAQLQAGEGAEDKISHVQAARLNDMRGRLAGTLDAVRSGLDALTIRAPADGRLTNFTVQPGQAVKPGDPLGQVDSEGSWKLTADVDEYYLGRIAPGQPARLADGTALTVSKVLPAVTNGRFAIELSFDRKPPADLRRGQTVDLRVTLGATRAAIVAPAGGWLDAGGGSAAYVLDSTGRHARRIAIRIGRRNPEQVEILSGLKPGDRIIITNMTAIKSDAVNIR